MLSSYIAHINADSILYALYIEISIIIPDRPFIHISFHIQPLNGSRWRVRANQPLHK